MTDIVLVDSSAWIQARRRQAPPDLREEFADLLTSARVATCGPVRWELLHTTNNLRELRARRDQLAALTQCPLTDADFDWAIDLCEELDRRHGGNAHRGVELHDALIAAAADRAGVPILHYDADFDRITAVTGQPTRWIRPRGSL